MAGITQRQQILDLVRKGVGTRAIARMLEIDPVTVSDNLRNLRKTQKLVQQQIHITITDGVTKVRDMHSGMIIDPDKLRMTGATKSGEHISITLDELIRPIIKVIP